MNRGFTEVLRKRVTKEAFAGLPIDVTVVLKQTSRKMFLALLTTLGWHNALRKLRRQTA